MSPPAPGRAPIPIPIRDDLRIRGSVFEEQAPRGDDILDVLLHRLDMDVVDLDEGLRDAEQADHDRHEVDPAHEADASEGVPPLAGEAIHPDHAEPYAQGAGEDPFRQGVAREAADEEEPHDGEHEIVPRGKQQGVFRDDRRAGRQGQDADVPADDGGGRREADRDPRLAELGERIAVESGGDGGGRPRDVQQDGRPGAAVDPAAVDARHQGEGLVEIPGKGERDEDRNGHRDRQAGDGADVDPGEGPHAAQEDHFDTRPRHQEITQLFHSFSLPQDDSEDILKQEPDHGEHDGPGDQRSHDFCAFQQQKGADEEQIGGSPRNGED